MDDVRLEALHGLPHFALLYVKREANFIVQGETESLDRVDWVRAKVFRAFGDVVNRNDFHVVVGFL